MVRGRQVGRPTAQAHHERPPAHLFSLSVVPIIGMIDSERSSVVTPVTTNDCFLCEVGNSSTRNWLRNSPRASIILGYG